MYQEKKGLKQNLERNQNFLFMAKDTFECNVARFENQNMEFCLDDKVYYIDVNVT